MLQGKQDKLNFQFLLLTNSGAWALKKIVHISIYIRIVGKGLGKFDDRRCRIDLLSWISGETIYSASIPLTETPISRNDQELNIYVS